MSIMDSHFCVLGRDHGEKSSAKLDFDAACNLIVELDFGVEGVGGGPALGEGDPAVGILALEFS